MNNKENFNHMNKIDTPPELDRVCIMIGRFIEYWGFKDIEGRIWAHILLSNRPLCAKDLIDRLGISKGLVSMSISRLLDYQVVRLEKIEGRKTQYFQVNENVTEVIKNVLRHRERKLISDIYSSVQMLEELSKEQSVGIDKSRLKFLKKMVLNAQRILKAIVFTEKGLNNFFFGVAPRVDEPK